MIRFNASSMQWDQDFIFTQPNLRPAAHDSDNLEVEGRNLLGRAIRGAKTVSSSSSSLNRGSSSEKMNLMRKASFSSSFYRHPPQDEKVGATSFSQAMNNAFPRPFISTNLGSPLSHGKSSPLSPTSRHASDPATVEFDEYDLPNVGFDGLEDEDHDLSEAEGGAFGFRSGMSTEDRERFGYYPSGPSTPDGSFYQPPNQSGEFELSGGGAPRSKVLSSARKLRRSRSSGGGATGSFYGFPGYHGNMSHRGEEELDDDWDSELQISDYLQSIDVSPKAMVSFTFSVLAATMLCFI